MEEHDSSCGWKAFFDIYAPHYMDEPFTRNTCAEVDFLIDVMELKLDSRYDACVCLCEGAFGLLNAGEDAAVRDISILRGIASALRPGRPFLLTALNALRTIRLYNDEDVASGRFDNIALCQVHSVDSIISDDISRELPESILSTIVREKAFTAMELTLMLRIAGFSVEHIWGGTAGNWGRRPLLMDENRIDGSGQAG